MTAPTVAGLVFERHEVDGMRWESARRPLDHRLTGLVVDALGYAEFAGHRVARRVTPHPAVTVIVGLGPPIAVDRSLLGSFVAGMHDSWGVTAFTGAQRGIELRLTPRGARRLLGIPPGELAGQVVELPLLDRLADRVAGAADAAERGDDGADTGYARARWAAALSALETELLRVAADGPDPDPAVSWAWATMCERAGAGPVGALAAEIGWSRRHFASRFRAEVGLPPKAAARVLRFDRARLQLVRGRPAAEVAVACGYTDQSHLVREFRALAGRTPGTYLAELDAEQVTFIQDG
jgi:AraC-like DNA-binding protein